ncbi:MAG: hypothetical protein P8N76_10075 [Pirellulaceae bacterium]|nr:hypothetical protein [Pirellulaceae bacterium]
MSLTVDALRKLEQSGAFPASVPHQADATPKVTDKPAVTKTKASAEEANAETKPIHQITSGEPIAAKPSLEIEPPISPENDQETGDGLPSLLPFDEEDFNIPATDSDQTAQPGVVESPLLPGTSANAEVENEEPAEAATPPHHQPDIKDTTIPQTTAAQSTTDTDCGKTEQSPESGETPEPYDLAAFNQEPSTNSQTPAQPPCSEVECDESVETTPALPLDSDPNPKAPISDSNDPNPFEPPKPELQHGAHRDAGRDHVSNLNPGPNAEDTQSADEADDFAGRDIEPLITESIESLEQILQAAEQSPSEEEYTTGEDVPVAWEIAPLKEAAEPTPTSADLNLQTDDEKNPRSPSEPIGATEDDDAYHPVIKPFYDLQEDEASPSETISTDSDDSQLDSQLDSQSREPELEQKPKYNPVEAIERPDCSTPSPEVDTAFAEAFVSDPVEPLPATTELEAWQGSTIPTPSAIEVETTACDYELELSASLTNADTEQRFKQLLSQIHARSEDGFPTSLLLLTPQPSERIADTVTHLSMVMAREGHEVVMLDANLAEQGLTRRYEALGKAGVCDVLTETSQTEDLVLATSNRSIHLLPCGDDVTGISRTQNSVEGRTIRNLLQTLTRRGQIVICDADSTRSTLAIPLAEAFDAVLLVVSMQDLDLGVLAEAIQMLRDRQLNLLGCVVTDA